MLKEYIENHKEEIITIPMENITLTSQIHSRGKITIINRPSEDLVIVVRQISDKYYTLVVGWNIYMNAKERGLENIKCIVTKDTRGGFLRKNLENYNIGKIKIPTEFVNHPPRPEKVQQKIDYYNENGKFRRKLRIDRTGMLQDGYATYLAAQQLGLTQVPVKCVM